MAAYVSSSIPDNPMNPLSPSVIANLVIQEGHASQSSQGFSEIELKYRQLASVCVIGEHSVVDNDGENYADQR